MEINVELIPVARIRKPVELWSTFSLQKFPAIFHHQMLFSSSCSTTTNFVIGLPTLSVALIINTDSISVSKIHQLPCSLLCRIPLLPHSWHTLYQRWKQKESPSIPLLHTGRTTLVGLHPPVCISLYTFHRWFQWKTNLNPASDNK